jgi:hypothetical protein
MDDFIQHGTYSWLIVTAYKKNYKLNKSGLNRIILQRNMWFRLQDIMSDKPELAYANVL